MAHGPTTPTTTPPRTGPAPSPTAGRATRRATRRGVGRACLAAAVAMAAAALAGCADPTQELSEGVERQLRDEAGVIVDATCEPLDGGELSGDTGQPFRCTVTSAEMDGELVVTGAVAPGGGSAALRVVAGEGQLGARAGLASP